MNLFHKIILLPVLAVCALLLVLLFFWSSGQRHQKKLTEISEDYIQAFYLSGELRQSLMDLQEGSRYAVILSDESALDQQAKPHLDRALAAINKAKSNPTLDKTQLDDLSTEMKDYYAAAQTSVRMIITNDENADADSILLKFVERYNRIKKKLDDFETDCRSGMGKAMTETNEDYRSALVTSTALIAVCVILLAGLTVVILRNIRGTLGSLITVCRDISNGNLDATLDINSNDPIGEMAAMFDRMRNSIRDRINALNKENAARRETEEQLKSKLALITLQQEAIKTMTTPAIEVGDRILALPIVGFLDSQRSQEMTDNLLEKIVSIGALGVIIDITSIDVIDTQTADCFIKMAKSAKLLGAQTVITGISPAIAVTLVGIEVNLNGIITLRTLREGLEFFLLQGLDNGAETSVETLS